jgi:hypothetical protein
MLDALMLSVVTQLQAAPLSYTSHQCGVQPDGQPPAACGELYLAVHAAGWQLDDNEHELLEGSYSLTVTLSARAGRSPHDRIGTGIVTLADTGLLARARAVAVQIHMSYDVMDRANESVPAGENGFLEPLRFAGVGPVMAKPPSWFWSDGKQAGPAGVAVEVRFNRARRFEKLQGDA